MSEPITISFVATREMKHWLERWARENDRSVSYIMRQMIERERRRRVEVEKQDKDEYSDEDR